MRKPLQIVRRRQNTPAALRGSVDYIGQGEGAFLAIDEWRSDGLLEPLDPAGTSGWVR